LLIQKTEQKTIKNEKNSTTCQKFLPLFVKSFFMQPPKSFYLILLAVFQILLNSEISYAAFLVSPPPPPDTICKGDTITYAVTSSPQIVSHTWSPNYHISNTNTPTVSMWPDTSTTYILTRTGVSSNLIFNGDFLFGNMGFTSAYTYTTNLWPEATYCIGTNPQTFHTNFSPCGDHTTGTGNMMVVNAAGTPNVIVWQQTIPVVPNTNYLFSCWLTSVHTSSPAQLQFFVNGVQIGPVFGAAPATCIWNMFFNTWNSGTATSAVISIRNQNTSLSGNDFAIDDIYFAQVINLVDTFRVVVEKPVVSLGNDTAICPGDSAWLTPGSQYAQYHWSNGQTTPAITVTNPGTYWVEIKTPLGCPASDTMVVNQLPTPQIITTNDSVCPGGNAVLTASSPSAASYLWSTGAATSTITISPPVTSSYQVIITDTMGCTDSAMATAVIRPVPQVSISNDTMVCLGSPVILVAGGGNSYYWAPAGQTTSNITVIANTPSSTYTVTVTDQHQCSDTASVTVDAAPYPVITLFQDTDTLCRGSSAELGASGGSSYRWSTGDVSPSVIITPEESSYYTVTVTQTTSGVSCSSDTSLFIFVKGCNVIYIPNAISLSAPDNIFKPVGESVFAEGYTFAIYNRWGQRLFITHDFTQGWDGTFNGQQVPEGVYVYDIMIGNGVDAPWRKQGTVTVVR
jgi:gliding motility-associated-like protein